MKAITLKHPYMNRSRHNPWITKSLLAPVLHQHTSRRTSIHGFKSNQIERYHPWVWLADREVKSWNWQVDVLIGSCLWFGRLHTLWYATPAPHRATRRACSILIDRQAQRRAAETDPGAKASCRKFSYAPTPPNGKHIISSYSPKDHINKCGVKICDLLLVDALNISEKTPKNTKKHTIKW